MPAYKWVTILIVVLIYSFAITPVERALKKRLTKKWLIQTLTFLIGFVIMYILYISSYFILRALNIAD